MAPITFNTVLTSDSLAFPELLPLVGKRVEIRVTEEAAAASERMLDHELHATWEAEKLADNSPVPSIEEILAMLSCIRGNMAEEITADREGTSVEAYKPSPFATRWQEDATTLRISELT